MIFGVLAKPNLKNFQKVKKILSGFLIKRKTKILFHDALKDKSNSKFNYVSKNDLIEESDVLIVFGGDGTLLHIAEEAAKNKKPVIGINLGNLGFLTEAPLNNLEKLLDDFFKGNLVVDTRELLEAKILQSNKTIFKTCFLNDVVINKGALGKIINLD